ncbi:MAG: hypothetical protein ACQEXQ_15685 [Bacillota bacterium]
MISRRSLHPISPKLLAQSFIFTVQLLYVQDGFCVCKERFPTFRTEIVQ